MAIINIGIDGSNMVPVNGQYTFTVTFIDPVTQQLITDNRFPQNQVYTTSTFVEPYFIPVQVADGNCTIGNVELRIKYKDQVVATGLNNRVINCNNVCTALPINTVTSTSNSSVNIVLSAVSVNTYNWRILNSSSLVVASGTSNVTTNNFNITTPVLPGGKYLLELVGGNCSGKSTKNFTVANTSLPDCLKGPTLLSILSSTATNLQFQFDGEGVFGITWRIKQGTTTIRTGVIKHTTIAQPGDVIFSNNSPTITYNTLSNGNYTLEIEGSTCTSEEISILPFTVSTVVAPLAFTNSSPVVSGTENNYTFSISINKAGAYLTTILNTETGVYYHNANVTYVIGTPLVKTGLPNGTYLVKVGSLEAILPLSDGGGGTPTPGDLPALFKTHEVIANGRRYTMIKSAGMDISISPSTGRISDMTAGLNTTNTPNTFNGRNAFYKLGEGYFGTSTNGVFTYKSFQNVELPNGVHTIRRFDCKPELFPNQGFFEAGWTGYPTNTAVNNRNCTLSEITIIINDL